MADNDEPTLARPTVEDLLAREGWMTEDPRMRHGRNPNTFWLPHDGLREAIGPGSQVRLLLWFIAMKPGQAIRSLSVSGCGYWLKHERETSSAAGLTSPPLSARAPLEIGQMIEVPTSDAIDVLDPEEDWRDHRDFLQAMFEGDEAFEEWKRSQPTEPQP